VLKRVIPLKSGYLSAVGLSSVKMVADSTDVLLIITSTGDGFLVMSTSMTLNDCEA